MRGPRMHVSRRALLQHAGMVFGSLALSARLPHFAPKAKRVIYLFMHGGPSQVDTFDPKPTLARYDGQPPSKEFHRLQFQFIDVTRQRLLASQQTFRKC